MENSLTRKEIKIAKKLFASTVWNGMREISSHTHCSDCGKMVARTISGDQRYFMLNKAAIAFSMVSEPVATIPNRQVMRPHYAIRYKESYEVYPLSWTDGRDENGVEHAYCPECAAKVIEAECIRCHTTFSRPRDMVAGWACERCLAIHAEAMCHISPGERVAGLVWNDQKANDHYELEMVHAEEHLIAEGVLNSLTGGES